MSQLRLLAPNSPSFPCRPPLRAPPFESPPVRVRLRRRPRGQKAPLGVHQGEGVRHRRGLLRRGALKEGGQRICQVAGRETDRGNRVGLNHLSLSTRTSRAQVEEEKRVDLTVVQDLANSIYAM